jgi:predicted nucleotidyltransferase
MEVMKKIKENLPPEVKILYVTTFGSKLYGTDTPESDTDYRGLFVPSKKRLLLQKKVDIVEKTTGNNNKKNTKEDTDTALISVHKFFNLLGKGDVIAIDILFSMFRRDTIVFEEPGFVSYIRNEASNLITKQSKAFIQYCLNHAERNGIKAKNLKIIQEIKVLFENLKEKAGLTDKAPIGLLFTDLKDDIEKKKDCKIKIKEMNGVNKKFLAVQGKMYQSTLSFDEFFRIINHRIDNYGERTRKALNLNNVDFRALSHSCRVIYEIYELLSTGKIIFPLQQSEAEFIRKVKQSVIPFEDVKQYIEKYFEEVNRLEASSKLPVKLSQSYTEKILLDVIEHFGI